MNEIIAVVWPYEDCRIFTKGDTVYYREVDNILEFWHPTEAKWCQSRRPNIMEDTCSISTTCPTTIPDGPLSGATKTEKKTGKT